MTAPAMKAHLAPSPAAIEIAAAVRDAASRGEPVRIIGGGTWLDAMRPVGATRQLRTAQHSGVVEYVPGDLTLTALAGTTLAELERLTSEHRQWLALDPPAGEAATIGATVATASYGPLASTFGRPRDQVLGVEFVTGDGSIVRGGGRVVKNVAGFDLTRLVTGSWGTLGVITEVSVRLRARAEREVSLAIPISGGRSSIAAIATELRRLPFAPMAAVLLDHATASRVGVGDDAGPLSDAATGEAGVLLLRIGGREETVAAQRLASEQLAHGARSTATEVDASIWKRLAAPEPAEAATLRISAPPTRFAECWASAVQLAATAARSSVQALPLIGVARVCMEGPDAASDALRHRLLALRAGVTGEAGVAGAAGVAGVAGAAGIAAHRVVFERLPSEWWRELDADLPETVAGARRLSRRVKDAYDPQGILNPGLMGI
jgi:glycolate oxidase FAD binding subunit